MSSVKKRLFYVVTLLIPFAFFAILELILLAINFGETPPLFIDDVSSSKHRVMNPIVSERYFPTKDYSTKGQYDVFLKEKTNNTFRVFVQGASSSAGFPYLHSGSFPRLLEQKLQHYYPNHHIEVINTSLAATNSYTLLDFVDEILAEQPDLVLIYSGHNEYYGALGVGSSQRFAGSVGLTNLYLKLKNVRTVQLLKNLLQWIYSENEKQSSQTLMSKMVRDESIPFGSSAYHQGLDQYSTNIGTLLSKYQEARVPVMISNLVSNLRDFEPFITGEDTEFDASLAFEQAKKFYEKEDFENALVAFKKARDYDLLKFRAPTDLVNRIPQLAEKYGARWIDMRTAFEKKSENGIIGNDLLLEHVHANLTGVRLFADVFFEEVASFLKEKNIKIDSSQSFTYRIAEVDSLYGSTSIQQLMSNWPFTDKVQNQISPPRNEIEKLIAGDFLWVAVMSNAFARQIETRPEKALTTALVMVQEYPHTAQPYLMAGEAYYKMKAYDETVDFLSQMPKEFQSQSSFQLQLNARLSQGNYLSALPIAKSLFALEKSIENQYLVAALTDITSIRLAVIEPKQVLSNPDAYIRALGALAYLKRTDDVANLHRKLKQIIPTNSALNQLQETLKLKR